MPEQHREQQTEYIHYGTPYFSPDLCRPVQNKPYSLGCMNCMKPQGGFWASATDAEFGWKDWNEVEEYRICSDENCVKFTLTEDARVLIINNADDLIQMPEIRHIDSFGHVELDFDWLAAKYDVIDFRISEDGRLYDAMYGWDCDSILVMDPDVVHVLSEPMPDLATEIVGTEQYIQALTEGWCRLNVAGPDQDHTIELYNDAKHGIRVFWDGKETNADHCLVRKYEGMNRTVPTTTSDLKKEAWKKGHAEGILIDPHQRVHTYSIDIDKGITKEYIDGRRIMPAINTSYQIEACSRIDSQKYVKTNLYELQRKIAPQMKAGEKISGIMIGPDGTKASWELAMEKAGRPPRFSLQDQMPIGAVLYADRTQMPEKETPYIPTRRQQAQELA